MEEEFEEIKINDYKRKSETPERHGVIKKRRTVSPVKQKTYDALKYCQKLLTDLRTNTKNHFCAYIFYEPVNAELLNCPDYYTVIKYPMDLSTIQTKMDAKVYKNEDDFAADIRIMIQNCFTFNGEDHPIAPVARRFQEIFEERFSRIKLQLEKSKVTIFDKLNQREKEVRAKILDHEIILEDLKDQLENIIQQRKEEEEKNSHLQKDFSVAGYGTAKTKRASNEYSKGKATKKLKKKAKRKKSTTDEEQEQDDAADVAIKSDSEEDDSVPSMTYDEMRKLSLDCNKLPSNEIFKVIEIIKKNENKKEIDENEEVFEVEFDKLKPITLRSIEKLLVELKKPKPPPKPKRGGGKTMQNPLNAEILSEQEKTLKKELENLDDQLGMGSKKVSKSKSPPPPPSSSSSDSSSSDDSSSSSSTDHSSDTLSSDDEKP